MRTAIYTTLLWLGILAIPIISHAETHKALRCFHKEYTSLPTQEIAADSQYVTCWNAEPEKQLRASDKKGLPIFIDGETNSLKDYRCFWYEVTTRRVRGPRGTR